MKKLFLIALCVLLLLALAGCGQKVYSDIFYKQITLEEAVAKSDFAVIGEYTGIKERNDHVLYIFDVAEVLYGDFDAEEVRVYEVLVSDDMDQRYEAGGKYILVLKESSARSGWKPCYEETAGAAKFPVDGPYVMLGEEITCPEGATFAEYVQLVREQVVPTE